MTEQVITISQVPGLVGILTSPNEPTNVALVIFNAGLIHHVGPHRLHVKLARRLSANGIATARFDLSGIGDSAAATVSRSRDQQISLEVGAIVDELAVRGHEKIVFCGICSGGQVALRKGADDDRVTGLVLVNPEPEFDDAQSVSKANVAHYLRNSIWRPRAWINLISGKVNYGNLVGAFKARFSFDRQPARSLSEIFAEYLRRHEVSRKRVLLLLSDRHAAVVDLDSEVMQALMSPDFKVSAFARFDHLFSTHAAEETLISTIVDWFSDAYQHARSQLTQPNSR